MLVHMVVSNFVFPMSDLIGNAGCFILVHLLDIFVRSYSQLFPVSVAVFRSGLSDFSSYSVPKRGKMHKI
jgi:hypothetical protein